LQAGSQEAAVAQSAAQNYEATISNRKPSKQIAKSNSTSLQGDGFFGNHCTGIAEIDELIYAFVANCGNYDIRECPPKIIECRPFSSIAALEDCLPESTSHDNETLKRLRHTKNFMIRYRLPHGDLKSVFDELMEQTSEAWMCVGLLDQIAEGCYDIMVYMRKNHTRFLKPDCFNLASGGPAALYNFVGARGANNCITAFGSAVQQTYSNITFVASTRGNLGFEAIQEATRTLTTQQFLTLKGKCTATPPKKRTEFEHIFLRVASSLSDIRREGLLFVLMLS
jgi:hypothetical protein